MRNTNGPAGPKVKQGKVEENGRTRWLRTGLSVAERIIVAMFDVMDDFDFAVRHDSLTMRMGARDGRRYLERLEEYQEEKQRRQALQRLIERKWVRERRRGDRTVHLLTKDGKINALKLIIRQTTAELPNGKECIISYDFPEAARRARREFRRFLKKRAHCRYFQQSVWKTNKDVVGQLRELIVRLSIDDWVQVIVTEPK